MPYHILKEYRMPDDYPILHSVFPSEDQNECLSLPLNQGGPIPQGNILIPIQGMYLSSFLGITKFLPSNKLITRLPLNYSSLG